MGGDPLLESAFYSARQGMAIVAPDGRFLRVNPALTQIVGYSEEELGQLTFQEITHPADLEPDLIQAERLVRGEIDGYDMEKRCFRKDGSVVWVELSAAVVRDQSGDPMYFPVNIFDLTKFREEQAKQTQQMLQKALSLLEGTLVGSEAGVGMLKIVKAVCAEPARHHELGVTNERETSAPAIKRRRGLTEREQKVLALVAKGKRNREIAQVLGISHRTVEVHRATAIRKMEAGLSDDLVRQLIASCVWEAAA
jgi:PAS domain S-box-containing protein